MGTSRCFSPGGTSENSPLRKSPLICRLGSVLAWIFHGFWGAHASRVLPSASRRRHGANRLRHGVLWNRRKPESSRSRRDAATDTPEACAPQECVLLSSNWLASCEDSSDGPG